MSTTIGILSLAGSHASAGRGSSNDQENSRTAAHMMDMNTTTSTFSDPASSLPEPWLRAAASFLEFVEQHGRLPAQLGASAETEAAPGRFLKNIRSIVKRSSVLTPEAAAKVAWMDENVPQWRTEGTRRVGSQKSLSSFEDRVKELAKFVDEHGCLPVSWKASPSGEAGLATFLHRFTGVESGTWPLTAAREAALDAAVPGWRDGATKSGRKLHSDSLFKLRFVELKTFVAANNRLPRGPGKAVGSTERALRIWINRQLRKAPSENRDILCAFLDAAPGRAGYVKGKPEP